ncbi:TPA: hypothetical protein OUL50_001971 [Clostridioides difficile]|uniref:hypothetical protein n=1 Tax=Clostridioides sp. ZZV15-6597 TaxID=2811500 RepID=UPI001C13E873|nr:hypothetical protein [Clostridioides difficile]MCC0664993.1 hypothetical protein [Clostridioides sp. ZZV15-6597]HBF9262936.1 hypothetical protein [Clostridioides difficile]HBG1536313.1 hypothetical protein [Clostridioides difficile]HCU2754273.1 hypothetical protein [Clostridioides difficile]
MKNKKIVFGIVIAISILIISISYFCINNKKDEGIEHKELVIEDKDKIEDKESNNNEKKSVKEETEDIAKKFVIAWHTVEENPKNRIDSAKDLINENFYKELKDEEELEYNDVRKDKYTYRRIKELVAVDYKEKDGKVYWTVKVWYDWLDKDKKIQEGNLMTVYHVGLLKENNNWKVFESPAEFY